MLSINVATWKQQNRTNRSSRRPTNFTKELQGKKLTPLNKRARLITNLSFENLEHLSDTAS